MRVKAIGPIRPAIEPHDYEGVEITEVPEAATEDDVERTLEQMRRDAATLVPADRPVQLGDVVTIDFAGSIDGEPFEGGTAQGQEAEMTESNFVPGFVEGILGMRAGETKDVAAAFPDPYANPELAGKAAVFTVTVHDVKERELPPLDDEFATRVSTSQTLEDLRADVKRRLDETVKGNARRRMSSELLDKIVALNVVPLPAVLVEREIDSLIADMQQYIARAGIGWDDYLAQAGKTADEVREGYRGEAERRVKTTLLVEAIAKKEGIAATQADVEAELDALAAQYGQPRARIIEALQSNVGALVDGIVRTKTIERMIEQAKRVPATETASA
jgi:trigger factor